MMFFPDHLIVYHGYRINHGSRLRDSPRDEHVFAQASNMSFSINWGFPKIWVPQNHPY